MIKLDFRPNDKKIVSRVKNSLAQKFKNTVTKQIDNAVWLSLYLYILEESEQAINILDSFIFDMENIDDREDLWGSYGNGILLLAYIYSNKNDHAKETTLVNMIVADDIMTNRTTRGNLLKEEFEYHQERMDWYPNETHKYRCEILGERFFSFVYYKELLPTFVDELDQEDVSKIDDILSDISKRLRDELNSN